MAARQQKRLTKELTDLTNGSIDGVGIDIVDDIITNWNVHIMGPSDTPYDGGRFTVNINFADNYPFKCPVI